jgi:pilus assembly protein Flp/PilA
MNTIRDFLKNDTGATAIEYGLIAALVSVAIIGILGTLGDNLVNTFTTVSDSLGDAGGDEGEGG